MLRSDAQKFWLKLGWGLATSTFENSTIVSNRQPIIHKPKCMMEVAMFCWILFSIFRVQMPSAMTCTLEMSESEAGSGCNPHPPSFPREQLWAMALVPCFLSDFSSWVRRESSPLSHHPLEQPDVSLLLLLAQPQISPAELSPFTGFAEAALTWAQHNMSIPLGSQVI